MRSPKLFATAVALLLAGLRCLLQAQAPLPLTGAGKGAPGGSKGLQTSSVAFWEYETTSWTDSSGNGNTLIGQNSPTTTAGVVGNAVNLVAASSQALTIASNAGLQI